MIHQDERESPVTRPIVWTVAGSDSSGGAGIQADLLTMNGLGVHWCSVVTALTVQDGVRVSSVRPLPAADVVEQLRVVVAGLPVRAVKCGMLARAATVRALVEELAPRLEAASAAARARGSSFRCEVRLTRERGPDARG